MNFNNLLTKVDYERAIVKAFRDAVVTFAAFVAANQSSDFHEFWQSMGVAAGLTVYRVVRDLFDQGPTSVKPAA